MYIWYICIYWNLRGVYDRRSAYWTNLLYTEKNTLNQGRFGANHSFPNRILCREYNWSNCNYHTHTSTPPTRPHHPERRRLIYHLNSLVCFQKHFAKTVSRRDFHGYVFISINLFILGEYPNELVHLNRAQTDQRLCFHLNSFVCFYKHYATTGERISMVMF